MVEHSYRARRASERVERITRARRNLAQAVASAQPVTEQTKLPRDRVLCGFGTAFVVVVGSQLVLAYAGLCSASAPSQPRDLPRKIQVVMAPLPLPVPELPAVEAPKLPPMPEVVAERPRPVSKPQPKAPVSPKEPAPTPAAAPLPIVGLILESTSSSADGAVFAVGQTLSGSTVRTAGDVHASESPQPLQGDPVAPKQRRNQVAAPRAAAGVRVNPARRLSRIEPVYPPLLGSQKLEADVTVRVLIGKDGTLLHAEIVRGAREAEFNQAALAAAKLERFMPESHDETPVETSLTYTYRFRITP